MHWTEPIRQREPTRDRQNQKETASTHLDQRKGRQRERQGKYTQVLARKKRETVPDRGTGKEKETQKDRQMVNRSI